MSSGIYTITNLVNGKIYVGMASHLRTRISGHLSELRKGTHYNLYLQSAWDKYGEENFVLEILEEYEKQFLIAMEHYWIITLRSNEPEFGYNIGETNPNKILMMPGKIREKAIKQKIKNSRHLHTKETKKKISKALKEFYKKNPEQKNRPRFWSQDSRNRISKNNKERIVSVETREKMSISRKGHRHSEETREKIRQKKIGKKRPEYKRKNPIPVIQKNLDGTLFFEYESLAATEKAGFRPKTVWAAIKRKSISHGYLWEYKIEES